MSPFLNPLNNLVFLLMLCVPAVVLLVPLYWRMRQRARILDLARKALEQGTTLPPEILQLLPERAALPSATRDIRRGWFLIVIAITLGTLGNTWWGFLAMLLGERSATLIARFLISVAVIPFFSGVALLMLGWAARRSGHP